MMKYTNQDVAFTSTREAKFINALAEVAETGDIEGFTRAVGEFDSVTRLDNWKTAILLKIKRGLENSSTDSGFGGGLV
jgi:alpha-soluble NSF attachment protein